MILGGITILASLVSSVLCANGYVAPTKTIDVEAYVYFDYLYRDSRIVDYVERAKEFSFSKQEAFENIFSSSYEKIDHISSSASAGGIFKAFQFGVNFDQSMDSTLKEFLHVANRGEHSQSYKESTKEVLHIETEFGQDTIIFYRCMNIGALSMCGKVQSLKREIFFNQVYFQKRRVIMKATVEDIHSEIETVFVENRETREQLSVQSGWNSVYYNKNRLGAEKLDVQWYASGNKVIIGSSSENRFIGYGRSGLQVVNRPYYWNFESKGYSNVGCIKCPETGQYLSVARGYGPADGTAVLMPTCLSMEIFGFYPID